MKKKTKKLNLVRKDVRELGNVVGGGGGLTATLGCVGSGQQSAGGGC